MDVITATFYAVELFFASAHARPPCYADGPTASYGCNAGQSNIKPIDYGQQVGSGSANWAWSVIISAIPFECGQRSLPGQRRPPSRMKQVCETLSTPGQLSLGE
jgi:hypothetical protein